MSATATRPVQAPGHRAARPPRRGSRTSLGWRVLRTEVVRSGPAAFAVVVVVVGAGVLATKLAPSAGWQASFAGALLWIDNTHLFFAPLAAVLGAWVAGAERRHGMGELLAATSRPGWRRVRLTWTALVVGVLAGVLVQAAVVVAAGLPTISYHGGRWLPTLAVVVLGVVLHAAAGFAVGRAVPGRLVAPLVGLAAFLVTALVTTDPVLRRMWPVNGLFLTDDQQLGAGVLGLLTVWLLGLTGTALVLALGRHRGLAVVPLAVAVLAAVPLVRTAGDSDGGAWTVDDPAAQQMVCTTDAGPQVCVEQVHAGLLDDVAPLAREQIAAGQALTGWTSARENVLGQAPPSGEVLSLPELEGTARAFRGGLADARGYLATSVAFQSSSGCYPTDDPADQAGQDAVTATVDTVARTLQTGEDQGLAAVPGASALHQRLAADPVAARAWMTGYLAAAPRCVLPELTRLAGA